MNLRKLVLAIALSGIAIATAAHSPTATEETVTPVFRHAISNVPGKSLVSVLVTYPPGTKSDSHHHAGSAFIYAYVISGAIRSQVDDGPVKVYKAGETWFEQPGAQHKISENASATESAQLLATFVVDSNDNPLTTIDKK